MAWLQQHASRVFRLASVISLIAAITWFLWPQDAWSLDPEALVAVLTAMGVWLWQEIANFPIKHPHPHDVRLLSKVVATVGPDQLRFLKEHDLGGSFRDKDIKFLYDIANNWKSIHYEFHDRKLQGRFANFVEATDKFVLKIAERSIPVREHWNSIVPYRERGSFFSKETEKAISSLNKEATELAGLYENFERLAQSRIRDA